MTSICNTVVSADFAHVHTLLEASFGSCSNFFLVLVLQIPRTILSRISLSVSGPKLHVFARVLSATLLLFVIEAVSLVNDVCLAYAMPLQQLQDFAHYLLVFFICEWKTTVDSEGLRSHAGNESSYALLIFLLVET